MGIPLDISAGPPSGSPLRSGLAVILALPGRARGRLFALLAGLEHVGRRDALLIEPVTQRLLAADELLGVAGHLLRLELPRQPVVLALLGRDLGRAQLVVAHR